jgi:hypothetical protein
MLGVSKLSWRACRPLLPVLLVGALLAVWIGQREGGSPRSIGPADGWDIPRLVAYLNDESLGLRMVATQKNGIIDQTAFLTTTSKGWEDLHCLPKDQKQINRWHGTLYCERGPEGLFEGNDWSDLTHQWGDCCLVVGPFLFYGDRELLGRVLAALTALAQSGDRRHSPRYRSIFP